MRSSISSAVVLGIVLLITACYPGKKLAKYSDDQSCISQALHGYRVVRVDERNHRLFVVTGKKGVKKLETALVKLPGCIKQKGWKDKWSLSLFSHEQYAGYADEPSIIPFHENDKWAKAYLAEYDHQIQELILSPVLNPKVKKVTFPE